MTSFFGGGVVNTSRQQQGGGHNGHGGAEGGAAHVGQWGHLEHRKHEGQCDCGGEGCGGQ